jgi:PIN domain nuclease of toxin-antitoxin system
MRLLLDSHPLIWFAEGRGLSERAREWIQSDESEVHVSVVSSWELGIKQARGKLRLDRSVAAIVDFYGFRRLPITWAHADLATHLPSHHGDPFDRMLVAQAQAEGLSIVTSDRRIAEYDVHTVPAR